MRNSSGYENKKFELYTIGEIKTENSKVFIHVFEDYRPALKYLEMFSHGLIFAENERLDINECSIKVFTAKLLRVDPKDGVLEVDRLDTEGIRRVFDIKAYFPCEDRVEKAITPDSVRGLPVWYDSDFIKRKLINISDEAFNNELKEAFIHPIGKIVKSEGECLLEVDGDEKSEKLFQTICGYSHVRVLWWCDKFDKKMYRNVTECNPPFEGAPRAGVFASRSPVRPNPIAITTVKVIGFDKERRLIKLSNIDAFDKTPVIGVYPYIPYLDRVKEFCVPEWFRHWPQWADQSDEEKLLEIESLGEWDIIRIEKFMEKSVIDRAIPRKLPGKNTEGYTNDKHNIVLRGVRQNNLKNINITIPKNKITVITGVSGCGKSSLAFDTIYAESQRRFMDCMSTAGRSAFEQFDKPDFDEITGLPPAVAIEQKTIMRNPRSTVGTFTDIYDYLRLLFSKIGTRHCPQCGRAIRLVSPRQIVDILVKLRHDTLLKIKPFGREEIVGNLRVPDMSINIDENFVYDLRKHINDALNLGNGALIVNVNDAEDFMFQTREICYHCNRIFTKLSTSTFSFNNPESMCPVCKGLGVRLDVDAELIVSNPDLSILDGASLWWGSLRKYRQNPNGNWMRGEIIALAQSMNVDLELPWKELPEEFKKQALYGSEGREVSFEYTHAKGRKGEMTRPVEGAFNSITRIFRANNGEAAKKIASTFMREKKCSECNGERLSAEGRLVSIGRTRFPETVIMTIKELKNWVSSLKEDLSEEELKISFQILQELDKKLQNLIDVGVPYLTLDRPVPTLSGGEAQRIRLAAQLGNGITDILYVLDEPSIGLHPRDHKKLVGIMERIRDEGNTVVVVEHDADTMLAADKIIDIGPGAGVHGGSIIAEGTPQEIMQYSNSETGKYLHETKNCQIALKEKTCKPYGWIKLNGARHNNLKNINVSIPLGVITCITGVSGSGKSSLIMKTLYPTLNRFLNKSDDVPGQYDFIEGTEGVDRIISISQQPIGRTPRSNPATYTGVFDDIRDLYASQEDAKKMGFKKNKFSFNSREGQCEACGGEGRKCVQMHFMPDVWVECSACHGKRFNEEALKVKYKDRSISDALDMNVEEAIELFEDNLKIMNKLKTLYDVGLGYIKLGQSAITLSGGEAQRVKLAKELSKADAGKTLFLLDEPTTGLHFSDVQNLLGILYRITEAGNTVLVIEHNIDVIRNSDWIIDLGPDGGDAGGFLVAQGTPGEVADTKESYTGEVLRTI